MDKLKKLGARIRGDGNLNHVETPGTRLDQTDNRLDPVNANLQVDELEATLQLFKISESNIEGKV
jgi:hypothetical protein